MKQFIKFESITELSVILKLWVKKKRLKCRRKVVDQKDTDYKWLFEADVK